MSSYYAINCYGVPWLRCTMPRYKNILVTRALLSVEPWWFCIFFITFVTYCISLCHDHENTSLQCVYNNPVSTSFYVESSIFLQCKKSSSRSAALALSRRIVDFLTTSSQRSAVHKAQCNAIKEDSACPVDVHTSLTCHHKLSCQWLVKAPFQDTFPALFLLSSFDLEDLTMLIANLTWKHQQAQAIDTRTEWSCRWIKKRHRAGSKGQAR